MGRVGTVTNTLAKVTKEITIPLSTSGSHHSKKNYRLEASTNLSFMMFKEKEINLRQESDKLRSKSKFKNKDQMVFISQVIILHLLTFLFGKYKKMSLLFNKITKYISISCKLSLPDLSTSD